MNPTRKLFAMSIALTLAAASAQSVLASAWSNPIGVAPSGHFIWDSGQDVNGLFGSPIVTINDRFTFNAGGFGISDPNTLDGIAASQGDTVSWNLHLTPGFQLTGMQVRVFGSYAIQGGGSYVDLLGTLSMTEFTDQGPGIRSESNNVVATPNLFPVNYVSGQDAHNAANYSAITQVDVSADVPMFDNDVHVSFSNLLSAFANGAGANASLNQTFQQFQIEVELIPEPGTLALLGLAVVPVICRRRR